MAISDTFLLPEILSIILETIYHEQHEYLLYMRCVSKQFNNLCKPLIYQECCIEPLDMTLPERNEIAYNIRKFCRYVIIEEDRLPNIDQAPAYWATIMEQFDGYPQLKSITLTMASHRRAVFPEFPIPECILRSDIELLIQRFGLPDSMSSEQVEKYLFSIPASNLVSLTVSMFSRRLNLEDSLLSRASRLRYLRRNLQTCPVSFRGHYPLLSSLYLEHGPAFARYLPIRSDLNLCALSTLHLSGIHLEQLLGEVDTAAFSGIRDLSITDPVYTPLIHDHSILLSKILEAINALIRFEFYGSLDFLPLAVLKKHSEVLRELSIRTEGYAIIHSALPQTFIPCLSQETCLTFLECDLDIMDPAWHTCLNHFANMSFLRTLILHTTPIRVVPWSQHSDQVKDVEADQDVKVAITIISYILRHQVTKRLSRLEVKMIPQRLGWDSLLNPDGLLEPPENRVCSWSHASRKYIKVDSDVLKAWNNSTHVTSYYESLNIYSSEYQQSELCYLLLGPSPEPSDSEEEFLSIHSEGNSNKRYPMRFGKPTWESTS